MGGKRQAGLVPARWRKLDSNAEIRLLLEEAGKRSREKKLQQKHNSEVAATSQKKPQHTNKSCSILHCSISRG